MTKYQIFPQDKGFLVKNLSTGEETPIVGNTYHLYKVSKGYKALLDAKKAGDVSNIIVEMDDILLKSDAPKPKTKANKGPKSSSEVTTQYASDLSKLIHESVIQKPKNLMMTDLKWKFLMRSILRAKNLLITGDSGCGKTQAALLAAKAAGRPLFPFNLGSTGDPRATLIGNTTFNKETGTMFAPSAFINAIKTPNAVILLDEISRAHPDAWNILMTVLDSGQRYARIDEAPGAPVVAVDPTVCFIATANIGAEYTSTRVLDRALLDRFTCIEMDILDDAQEAHLLGLKYPNIDKLMIQAIAEIAHHTRLQKIGGQLSTHLSTRASEEICQLIADDFTLEEAAEIAIYPLFDADGGTTSERTFVKQLVQKYCTTGTTL